MGKNTVGIIFKSNNDDILYYENNFFIELEISKKDDLRFILEDKLNEILDKKAFRIDKISKKIPNLDLSNECIDMYLVDVYMYYDDSKFLSKEAILDKLSISVLKDYYLKYIVRYDKYRYLVELYVGMLTYLFFTIVMISDPIEIRNKFLLDTLFYNFWIVLIVFILLPAFILNKFVVPSIAKYLLKYDISKKFFKASKLLYCIANIGFLIFLFV